jgi:hypothetical protein
MPGGGREHTAGNKGDPIKKDTKKWLRPDRIELSTFALSERRSYHCAMGACWEFGGRYCTSEIGGLFWANVVLNSNESSWMDSP